MKKSTLIQLIALLTLVAFTFTGCETIFQHLQDILPSGSSSQTDEHIPLSPLPQLSAIAPISSAMYYGYSNLNETEQKIYEKIGFAIENLNPEIDISQYDLSAEQAEKIYRYYLNDHPGDFWVDTTLYKATSAESKGVSTVIKYNPVYTCSSLYEKQVKQQAVEDSMRLLLDGIGPEMSEFDREVLIFKRIVKMLDYEYWSEDKKLNDIYSVLTDKKALCEGYAKLFQYAMYSVGTQCLVVCGYVNGTLHMWNIFNIDGNFYQADPTFNDPVGNNSGSDFAYLNLTDQQMITGEARQLSDNLNYPLPACTETADNYYVRTGRIIAAADAGAIPELAAIYSQAIQNGENTIGVRLSPDINVNAFIDFLSTWENYQKLNSQISKTLGKKVKVINNTYSYINTLSNLTLSFSVT